MGYICKNCGKLITNAEYKKIKQDIVNKNDLGCLFIGTIILFCCSIVLIPIAIILILILDGKKKKIECPSCKNTDCILPTSTPIGSKLLQEHYNQEQIKDFISTENQKEKLRLNIWLKLILWLVISYVLLAFILAISWK